MKKVSLAATIVYIGMWAMPIKLQLQINYYEYWPLALGLVYLTTGGGFEERRRSKFRIFTIILMGLSYYMAVSSGGIGAAIIWQVVALVGVGGFFFFFAEENIEYGKYKT